MIQELKEVLDSIDDLLSSYIPGELTSDRLVSEIIQERVAQQPMAEKVILMANKALEKFPLHPELIKRRAIAKTLIITETGENPYWESIEADFSLLLEIDPNNINAGVELLKYLFSSSELEDIEVAEIAKKLANQAQAILLEIRGLEIKALGYSDHPIEAEEVFSEWSNRFRESPELKSAIDHVRLMSS